MASFFVDPWRLYESGQMEIRPEMDAFAVNMVSFKPHATFQDFGQSEPPSFRLPGGQGPWLLQSALDILRPRPQQYSANNPRGAGFQYDGKYGYRPLEGSRTIRLLELCEGSGIEELTGHLHHVPLDDFRGGFLAISYAWGHSLKPFTLRTPEGVIGLTVSLCLGLRRLRREDRPLLVWADAICIDQSREEEKRSQILLMPEIFRAAHWVPAWLGEERDSSGRAMDCLHEMVAAASTAVRLPEESAMWDSISKLFGRPWFQRAWVVQELVLAPQVVVFCGNHWAPWDEIYEAAKICTRESSTHSATGVMKHIVMNASAILSLGDLRRSYQERGQDGQRELLTLLARFQYTRATLQRDKLFALLGLACDAAEPEFYPDYRAPLEVIVRRYAGVFIRRGGALELLYRAGSSSARFPSWVPDWITNTPRQSVITWPNRLQHFATCTQEKAEIRLSSDDDSVLVCRGYLFDPVDKVGEVSFETSDRLSYLRELVSFVQSRSHYPTKERLEDLAWKIAIGDAAEPVSSATGKRVDFRVAYQAFEEYLQLGEQTTDWNTELMQARAMAKMKRLLFRPQELRQLLWPYLHTALEFAERFPNARACLTRNGYIGIVPGSARKGDMIAVLHGSAVPFVVRKITQGRKAFTLLGACYIHGIMHGVPQRAANPVEDLLLV